MAGCQATMPDDPGLSPPAYSRVIHGFVLLITIGGESLYSRVCVLYPPAAVPKQIMLSKHTRLQRSCVSTGTANGCRSTRLDVIEVVRQILREFQLRHVESTHQWIAARHRFIQYSRYLLIRPFLVVSSLVVSSLDAEASAVA